MQGEAITLLIALAGVCGLVLASRLAQGPALAGLDSSDKLSHLLPLLHGGFAPESVAIDKHGRGAIMVDRTGRVAIAGAVGTHFFVRLCDASLSARLCEDRLRVSGPEFAALLDLPGDPGFWLATLRHAGARA